MWQKGKIITYLEIVAIATGESKEALIDVRHYNPNIIARYEQKDMIPYTGERIFVRDTVARKLAKANKSLAKKGAFVITLSINILNEKPYKVFKTRPNSSKSSSVYVYRV